MWRSLSVNSGSSASSAVPRVAEAGASRLPRQCVWAIVVERHRRALHRPQQPDAALDLAVVEHQARGGNLHGRAAAIAR